jgi:uncharacterized RDD family membrane protein YckC
MSRLKVPTNFNIELEFEIPAFHRRWFAWMIDVTIIFTYFFVALKILNNLPANMTSSPYQQQNRWSVFMILILPMSLYPLVMELTMNGQTVGKKLLNLRVINESGGNATLSQFLIRWMLRVSDLFIILVILSTLTGFISSGGPLLFFFLLLVTDILCVAITNKSQRLGDMAAATLLIKTKTKSNLDDTVFLEIEDSYTPRYPEVMRLSDRDMNVIKNIFVSANKRKDYNLAGRTADKIKGVLQIRSDEDVIDFLETLLKDYNYLSTY